MKLFAVTNVTNGQKVLVNPKYVVSIATDPKHTTGSIISFISTGYPDDYVRVKESIGQIMAKLEYKGLIK